ncbi:MAG: chemotaxis protein CheR [Sphingobacteriaceae bacterium]|nr:chemotaxis protein CheR [Sphingobacteriaceae bacterium]
MKESLSIHISDEEIQNLNKMIYIQYGYDFSDYSLASYKRRLSRIMINFKILNLTDLEYKLVEDELFFNVFLEEVTVNVTEMFRDPDFYKCLRRDIIPQLSTYPMIRIWHAGCSTGEEVYSLAILLKEADLLKRSLLYATDINEDVLIKAKSGSFSLELMKEYNENYKNTGGLFDLSDYYTVKDDRAIFNEEFRNRMVFSPHNLIQDKSFNEFNLILCRNVLIYFNRDLQNRVIKLFSMSLSSFGYLALGSKETLELNGVNEEFELVNKQQKIWKRKK